jgi:pilus assembly protein CpaF
MTAPRQEELIDRVCHEVAAKTGPVALLVAAAADRIAPLMDDHERADLVSRAVARLEGLDALQHYLDDDSVDEVLVNRGGQTWIERDGSLVEVEQLPRGAIDVVLQRVLAPIGRRLDRTTPIVDARLDDGSRLCAVIAPIAVDGTVVAIRRHRVRRVALDSFANAPIVELVVELLSRRANILVTGATSSGKTTFLAALLRRCATTERCVVIEDTAELELPDHHLVRLETRRANLDGITEIDADELVRTALRLRPDRLVVGEFRGREALAAVQALNTGHDGSLATCHANSALDGLRRLEGLVLQAAPTWPMAAIRRQVSRSVDAVVHLERIGPDRRVVEIIEPLESDGEPDGRLLATIDSVVDQPVRRRR